MGWETIEEHPTALALVDVSLRDEEIRVNNEFPIIITVVLAIHIIAIARTFNEVF